MRNIFVHIPKTAGTTTIHYLMKRKNIEVINHVPVCIDNNIDITKLNIKSRKIDYQNSFIFSFVRNPYTRILSAYNYLYNGGNMKFPDLYYKKIIDKYKISNDPNINFLAFLKDIDSHKKNIVHFVPQYEFVTHDDKILAHYVGKVENYENDMKIIFPDFVNDNIKLNKSEYVIKGLTDEAKKMIYASYQKDFELFGYS